MEKHNFPLDSGGTSKVVRWFQLFFGTICLVTAIAWVILYPGSIKAGLSFWISLLFLIGFGIFQINAGLGRGRRFIEIEGNRIIIKKSSLLTPREIGNEEIDNIRIMPLNIVFILKNKRIIMVRLGTTYTDVIKQVKDAILGFASEMNIPVEFVKEEI